MNLEERFEALDKLVRRLEDGLTVEAAMTARHRERVADHERWLQDHDRAWKRHEEWLLEHNEAMRELDKKLDRIADMLGFRGGQRGRVSQRSPGLRALGSLSN
jgi:hypothetical protein